MTADNVTEIGQKDSKGTERRRLLKLLPILGLSAVALIVPSANIIPVGPQHTSTPNPDDQEQKVRDLFKNTTNFPKDVEDMIEFSKFNPTVPEKGDIWDHDLQALRITRVPGDSTFRASHIAETKVDRSSGLVFTNVCGTSQDGFGCYVIYVSKEELNLPHGGQ